MFSDISARNDFYFEPNTDKRYNRWKRRRKKVSKQVRDGKQQELRSPDDSSAEEEANDEEDSIAPERPDSQPKVRRRRRETLKKLFGSEQAMLCYDASSDLTSSDRDNYMSVANNLRTCNRAPISDEEFGAFIDKSNGIYLYLIIAFILAVFYKRFNNHTTTDQICKRICFTD